MILKTDELLSVSGGNGFNVFAGICAAVAFLISVVDGFLNSDGCKS